eukprot:gnl/TRDRNA2_/TRDRNA2_74364_c1_seq1.p1 gnl/TRDRNA2_/TRDRNA2_74364_c1~~gnl/TRDRNA2_/TRDRNA2_74364_c1_seq1.p1  ORF type:complete len:266 (+),score=38.73 gnl/TRDRNA2_/TRDRNA2_74364_c1_seq1:85-798(+)
MPSTLGEWVSRWAQLRDQLWHGDFTPIAERVSTGPLGSVVERLVRKARITAWSSPPYSPEARHLNEADWPNLLGGGTIWQHTRVPFNSYVPINFQSHRFTCKTPMNFTELFTAAAEHEMAAGAVSNMESAMFVGVLEQYQVSMCVLIAKVKGELPDYCDCHNKAKWDGFSKTQANMHSHKLNIDSFPAEVLANIDKITAADRKLYEASWNRLVRDVTLVEWEYNTTVMCNKTMPPLQ